MFHDGDPGFEASVPSDNHDGNIGIQGLDGIEHVLPGHVRHAEIREHEVHRILAHMTDRSAAVRRFRDRKTFLSQESCDGAALRLFVVDNQDAEFIHLHLFMTGRMYLCDARERVTYERV